jgi:hypothetical protein
LPMVAPVPSHTVEDILLDIKNDINYDAKNRLLSVP